MGIRIDRTPFSTTLNFRIFHWDFILGIVNLKHMQDTGEADHPAYVEDVMEDVTPADELEYSRPKELNIRRVKLDGRQDEMYNRAYKKGWICIDYQPEHTLLSFWKDGVRLNFWPRRMCVGTSLAHPKKGRTQLFRKHLTWDEVEKILANPRAHTQKGYY